MVPENVSATTAALEVGCESASQTSREHARQRITCRVEHPLRAARSLAARAQEPPSPLTSTSRRPSSSRTRFAAAAIEAR
jgi:hypothetical protein